MKRHKGETEGCDCWPKLPRIDPTPRHCVLDPLNNVCWPASRQKALHPEEVCVEDGCEDDLIHNDFDANGEDLRAVVEVARQPQEPVVPGNRSEPADDQRTKRSNWIVWLVSRPIDALRRYITQQVHDQCANQLYDVGMFPLRSCVCAQWCAQ